MRIRLADFKEGVLTQVHETYDPKHLDLEFVDLAYEGPLRLEGWVEKGETTLTFRGHLTSEIRQTCGRCLKVLPRSLDQPFEFFYEIKNKEVIETLDDLREILILDHPLSFLCREDCRGLCPECGSNRNEVRCHCVVNVMHRGLRSPLKEFWMKGKKEKTHGQS